MRAIIWLIRILLFILLLGFAIKNDHLAQLHFFMDQEWQLPLVFIIIASFAAGAVLGVTATFASLLRQRRQLAQLRRQLSRAERELQSPSSSS